MEDSIDSVLIATIASIMHDHKITKAKICYPPPKQNEWKSLHFRFERGKFIFELEKRENGEQGTTKISVRPNSLQCNKLEKGGSKRI